MCAEGDWRGGALCFGITASGCVPSFPHPASTYLGRLASQRLGGRRRRQGVRAKVLLGILDNALVVEAGRGNDNILWLQNPLAVLVEFVFGEEVGEGEGAGEEA